MLDEEYEIFFEELNKFKEKQQKQKERGLNDYNLLTTVLNEHDEVRLHSRVIGSLLDVNGLHYQKELFLEKFLEIIKGNEFKFNIQESKIFLEYRNIDLYLTDGIKHIIIENKIYAEDQENQIKRYYDLIKNDNENLEYNDILVIYLSIDRIKPSPYSLEKLAIKDNYLIENNEKIAIFKNINYKNEILNWLDNCLYEIQNITNLNESIQQYKNVVEKITNKYKGKVMSLKELLKNEKYFKLAEEISAAFQEVKNEKISEIKEKQLNLIIEIIEEKKLQFINYLAKNWTAIDVLSELSLRIIANENDYLIQVFDKSGYGQDIDKLKKEVILEKLIKIDNRFKSAYSKVYGQMTIDYKDTDKEKLNDLVAKLINFKDEI